MTTAYANQETTHQSAVDVCEWKELAVRESDGLTVWLLWSKATNRVRVEVADERFGMRFAFDVAGADALAAYNHPFAFA